MLRDVPLTESDELAALRQKDAKLGPGAEDAPLLQSERRSEVLELQGCRSFVRDRFGDTRELLEVVGDPVGRLEEEEDLSRDFFVE